MKVQVGILLWVLTIWSAISLSCCQGRRNAGASIEDGTGNLMEEAGLLKLYNCGSGIYEAIVVNPWDSAMVLGHYMFVPDSVEKEDFACVKSEGCEIVRIPLRRSLVYSGVHASAIDELGNSASIAAVAEGEYVRSETLRKLMQTGEVADIGSSINPSVEKIMTVAPDAILLSPFENAGHGAVGNLGIALIECADYMEATPKGRAEWIKLLGVLYGCLPKADSIYHEVATRYDSIAAKAAQIDCRPLVLTEKFENGYWFVPGGRSYMARMIQDAGGRYPWAGDKNSGSLQLDFSRVYADAAQADVWLLRTWGGIPTLKELQTEYSHNVRFVAFRNKNVYSADTERYPLFEISAFHPDCMIQEYFSIFHPDSSETVPKYFKKLK